MVSTNKELDEALVMHTQAGDQHAFAILFLRCKVEIYICLMSVVQNDGIAQDLLHDTYIKAWRHIQYLKEPSRFKPWLLTIARHLAFDRLRNDARERTLSLEESQSTSDAIDYEADPQVIIESAIDRDRVLSVLAQMEPVYREILLLLNAEGFSRTEIAQKLGYTESTVRTYLSLARKQFRQLYQMMNSQENDMLEEDRSPVGPEGVRPGQDDHSQEDFYQQQPSAPVDPDRLPPDLHPPYREVLLLQEKGLSHADIAERLGITEENVRVRLHRARQQQKELIEQEEQKRLSRRLRTINPVNEDKLQKLLCGDSFFQSHFYPPYAEILRLVYGEALTDQDIATRLGIPLGTVKSRLTNAISYLDSFSPGA